jgi:hypothetical protein
MVDTGSRISAFRLAMGLVVSAALIFGLVTSVRLGHNPLHSRTMRLGLSVARH